MKAQSTPREEKCEQQSGSLKVVRDMGRNVAKASRLYQLRERLKTGRYSTKDLAKLLGVSQRSIQRDLFDLRQAGEEILTDEQGRYYIPSHAPLGSQPYELLLRYATFRFFYHQAPTRHRYFLDQLRKLVKELPDHIRHMVSYDLDAYEMGAHRPDRVLEMVLRAWQERRVLRVGYRDTKGRKSQRDLEIWFLEINRWNLAFYALARLHGSQQPGPSLYKLARMFDPQLLEDTYEIPPSFNPHELLKGAWGITLANRKTRVVLRFDPKVAWRLGEGDLPEPLASRKLQDDRLEVEYEVNTDLQGYPFELLGWVLSWGSLVEVVAPEDLRARWQEEIRAMAERWL